VWVCTSCGGGWQAARRALSEKVIELEVTKFAEQAVRDELDALRARTSAAAADYGGNSHGGGDADDAALELRLLRDDLMDEVHGAAATTATATALGPGGGTGSGSAPAGALAAYRDRDRDRPPADTDDHTAVAALVTAQLDRCRALLMEKERELVAAAARAGEERERVRSEASRSIAAASHHRHELSLKLAETQQHLADARADAHALKVRPRCLFRCVCFRWDLTWPSLVG